MSHSYFVGLPACRLVPLNAIVLASVIFVYYNELCIANRYASCERRPQDAMKS